ncbi:MAG: acyl-CoA dehydrogenase family protein [Deltaproteobacteria bacterium]|nr:acyl-CoA dehydrogenase family protein [Deltaproteobacteria bacterium]MBW2305646.1 acyl-CoA dehydrogenase family protein [Deltaproteobacteria bacterium]
MDFNLTEEQRILQDSAKRLAEREFAQNAFTWEERGEYPWQNLKILAENGFTGIRIPQEDGGQGGELLDAIIAMEAVSKVCPHSGDCVQATNFGAIQQLAVLGSRELKQQSLVPLLKGDGLITVAMSEPNAGSAVTDLQTAARLDGDSVVINGSKIFNSNGPHATCFVVWVRFGKDVQSSGAVLVDHEAPGFSRGKTEYHMSGEAHCMLYFDDCRVPRGNIIVEEDGFRRLLPVFNIERLGNSTRSLALAQACFDRAVQHAKERQQFNRPICEFQGIQWKVAEMKMKLDAARLLLYRAAVNAQEGTPSALETSIAKAYCNQTAFEVAHEAVQIMGGYGYSREFPVEYMFRRIRGWMIAGGTIEMLKNRIASEVFGRRFSQRPPRPKA